MSAMKDALDLMVRARDAWANGEVVLSLELLDAATACLNEGGHSKEDTPIIFELIERVRGKLAGSA